MTKYPIVHRVAGKFPILPDHVNAYLIELEKVTIVVDATIAISSALQVRHIAESLDKPIEAVLLTHGHPDHYSGLKVFEDIPRYASKECLEFAKREDASKGYLGKQYQGDDYPDVRVFPDVIIKDDSKFVFGDHEFKFHDLGPGESDSDSMWVVEGESGQHVFVGDVIAKNSHSFFKDGHIKEWMQILDRLERDFDESTKFYYGHGEAPAGLEAITWQRKYNQIFIDAVTGLKDRSLPVSKENQEKVIAAMNEFLPNGSVGFLLEQDLPGTIAHFWKIFS